MATKPTPGGSDGTYGTEMNAFLDVSLASDGKVKDGAVFSTSAAPTVDAGVTNKKHVDDNTTMVPAITGAGTGYAGEESITFPNGFIFKVKNTESVSTGDTITFGTAFNTVISVIPIVNTTVATTNITVDAITTTNFKVHHNAGGPLKIHWIAMGY